MVIKEMHINHAISVCIFWCQSSSALLSSTGLISIFHDEMKRIDFISQGSLIVHKRHKNGFISKRRKFRRSHYFYVSGFHHFYLGHSVSFCSFLCPFIARFFLFTPFFVVVQFWFSGGKFKLN